MEFRFQSTIIPLVIGILVSSTVFADSIEAKQVGHWDDVRQLGTWTFHANFSLVGYEDLLNDVGQLQIEVPRKLGLKRSNEPVQFYLLRRKSDYRQYLKRHFPTIPYRPALFIKQDGNAMVFAHVGKEFAIDLRHEATHAILHGALPVVPLWLDEGLAEYFETPRSSRTVGSPHVGTVSKQRRGDIQSLRELELLEDFATMKNVHYRDSWAWTHYLLNGPQPVRTELRSFLSMLQQHAVPDPLSQRLEQISSDPENDLIRHLSALSARRRIGLPRFSFRERLLAR